MLTVRELRAVLDTMRGDDWVYLCVDRTEILMPVPLRRVEQNRVDIVLHSHD